MMRSSASRARPRLPWFFVLPAVLALGFVVLPLGALLLRVPWSRFTTIAGSRPVLDALTLSLFTAFAATLCAVGLGLPLAYVLARGPRIVGGLLRACVLLPLVLPPVVGGVALLMAYGRTGVVGSPVHQFTGASLPFTTAAVMVAQTYVALPFLVMAVEGALRHHDERLDQAAAVMGAAPWRVFRTVTLPLIRPSLVAGVALAWARALGEFGATITFAGNFPGTTQTMPLATYLSLDSDPDAALALSVVLMALCATVLVALRRAWVPGMTAR